MRPTSLSPAARLGAALIAFTLCASETPAQTFDSGSDGTDGALTFAPNTGAVEFNPATLGLDISDNIFHFTTITIGAGTTVRLRSGILGEGRPVVWLATGDVTIDGVVDLDGAPGHAEVAVARLRAEAGAGGYNGGRGNNNITAETALVGNGQGGGRIQRARNGGGGGYASTGSGGGGASGGPAYGNSFLQPLLGGSGGGGGWNVSGNLLGGGGGAGGGALLVASSTRVSVSGSVLARGGDGVVVPVVKGRRQRHLGRAGDKRLQVDAGRLHCHARLREICHGSQY